MEPKAVSKIKKEPRQMDQEYQCYSSFTSIASVGELCTMCFCVHIIFTDTSLNQMHSYPRTTH